MRNGIIANCKSVSAGGKGLFAAGVAWGAMRIFEACEMLICEHRFYPCLEKKKIRSDIIQNMSDIF